jgi:class 3 adenylate cyclase/pimeloyl-ACP methyl ester carboxylesterase
VARQLLTLAREDATTAACKAASVREIEYARTEDGTHLAYRVLDAEAEGHSQNDIVMVSGGLFPMEVFEDDPGFVRLLQGLRSFGRMVVFDRRGIGQSDPIVDWERPILDQWADDLSAVVEASGAQDGVVFAWDGYGVATRFAARHSERLRLLVLHQPQAMAEDHWDEWVANRLLLLRENLGQDTLLEQIAPSRADEASFRDWYRHAGRAGASPATAARIWESVYESRPGDQLLGEVETPTLVLYRRDNVYSPADAVRIAASQIRGATLVELAGADHFPFIGDVDSVVAEIADFVVGQRRLPPPQRLLAALMFTDLVASTERAASLGDTRWKSVLDRHDAVVRAAVGNCGGTVVKTTGDGVLAFLPSAGSAVRAAERIRDQLGVDGLAVRIGIHVSDIDRRGDDISGIGVNITARVMAVADSGEIAVTPSVPIALTGQVAAFETLGTHQLKGVPGEWELFRLSGNPPRGRPAR